MGLDIFIGNATEHFYNDSDSSELYSDCDVEQVFHENAKPISTCCNEGKENYLYTTYSKWSDFVHQTGLNDFFHHRETGLMTKDNGCTMIKSEHHAIIKSTIDKIQQHDYEVPLTVPISCGLFESEIVEILKKDSLKIWLRDYDQTLGRLIWFEYWMRWALDNCETPAIEYY